MYYCSVGGKTHGRALVEEHADLCIAAGLTLKESIRVANGNFSTRSKKSGDEIWVAFIRSINRKVWILY
jgi:glutamine synthetase